MNDPQKTTLAMRADLAGEKFHYTEVYDEMCEDLDFLALIPHLLWDRDPEDWSTFAEAEESARFRLGMRKVVADREAAEVQREESRDA